MQEESQIEKLSPAIRHELSICGITTDAQLARSSAQAIWKDLQQAKAFFPDEQFSLTLEQLQKICINNSPAEISQDKESPRKISPSKDFTQKSRKDTTSHDPYKKVQGIHSGLSKNFHAMRAVRPTRIYLAAIASLGVPLFFISLVVVPLLMATHDIYLLGKNPVFYAAYFIGILIPHFIFVKLGTCSVCHMQIMTYRKYTRNKYAHNIFLLGPTIATALHIIFFFQFCCPGCGCQQKLFAKARHKRRS